MPTHADIAWLVALFKDTVKQIPEIRDRASREARIAQAFAVGADVLDEVIRDLETSEYKSIFKRFWSPIKLQPTVIVLDLFPAQEESSQFRATKSALGSPEILEDFLAVEKTLLHLSGWHDEQTAQVVDYISSNLNLLLLPPKYSKLLKDLRWLRDEMRQLSKNKARAAQRTYLLTRLRPLLGGVAIIILDIKAKALISNEYSIASIAIGANIVSTNIADLPRGWPFIFKIK